MFSSNQIIEISGEFEQLEAALSFALKMSGHDKNMTRSEIERGCKLTYQISPAGWYCIGWAFKNIPNGWNEYPFDFQTDIVSKIIVQYLKKHPPVNDGEYEDIDGSSGKGFIMKHNEEGIYGHMCNAKNNIENPGYCIVYFQPYENYYAK